MLSVFHILFLILTPQNTLSLSYKGRHWDAEKLFAQATIGGMDSIPGYSSSQSFSSSPKPRLAVPHCFLLNLNSRFLVSCSSVFSHYTTTSDMLQNDLEIYCFLVSVVYSEIISILSFFWNNFKLLDSYFKLSCFCLLSPQYKRFISNTDKDIIQLKNKKTKPANIKREKI